MPHKKEIFPVLKNLATGLAEVLSVAKVGEAVLNKIGLTAFIFKDNAGNFVMPTLNSEGAMFVTSESAGIPRSAHTVAEVAGALTEVMVAEVTLVASKTYGKITAKGSCFKEAVFKLYQVNGVSETLIGSGIVGPGQYDTFINSLSGEFVSGATGTQKLILRALNIDETSDFLGSVACLEFAV